MLPCQPLYVIGIRVIICHVFIKFHSLAPIKKHLPRKITFKFGIWFKKYVFFALMLCSLIAQ